MEVVPHPVSENVFRWMVQRISCKTCCCRYCSESGVVMYSLSDGRGSACDIRRLAFESIMIEAPAPSRPIECGIASPGLLVRVLTPRFLTSTESSFLHKARRPCTDTDTELQPLVNVRTTEARQTGSHFIQMEYVY